jgi:hypothetical protein
MCLRVPVLIKSRTAKTDNSRGELHTFVRGTQASIVIFLSKGKKNTGAYIVWPLRYPAGPKAFEITKQR